VGEHVQIGVVAERTGLSLRSIRWYEEVGLVEPSARSQGGFRLYTEPDIARLNLITCMKPLGFPLEEMRELLGLLDPAAGPAGTGEAAARLAEFGAAAERSCAELRAQLRVAEEFTAALRRRLGSAPGPGVAGRSRP
jgi:DNA-binding transcriptional MerR regulator